MACLAFISSNVSGSSLSINTACMHFPQLDVSNSATVFLKVSANVYHATQPNLSQTDSKHYGHMTASACVEKGVLAQLKTKAKLMLTGLPMLQTHRHSKV